MGAEHESSGPVADVPAIVRRMNAAYDWTGPDDPDNPRNFPLIQRIFSVAIITSLAFASAFSGSIYAPAQDAVMRRFGENYLVAVLPLSLYSLGLAFGPLVGAPLSETYGRKIVFVVTTPVSLLFMLGASFAQNIETLIVCRFFAGVFASPNINNASATLMDFTDSRYRGATLGIYYSLPSLGTTMGPLVGGFVQRSLGWRWTQWVAIIVTLTLYINVFFTKETYKRIILRRRAVKMGLTDTASQQTSVSRAIRHFFRVLILRPLHMLFTEPIVTLVSLYNGFIFGLLFTFVVSIPWIFRTYYGFSENSVSLSYLGVTLGTLFACVPFVIIDHLFYQKRLQIWQAEHEADQLFPPEHRLLSAIIGSLLLPISLLIAGWTTEYRVYWFVPVFFQGLTMMASLLVYAGVNLFMLDAYGPLYGASASSAMMLMRYTMSFTFPLFALRIYQALGSGWTNTILAVCLFVLAPVPWCFWVYGARIRAKIKYETSI